MAESPLKFTLRPIYYYVYIKYILFVIWFKDIISTSCWSVKAMSDFFCYYHCHNTAENTSCEYCFSRSPWILLYWLNNTKFRQYYETELSILPKKVFTIFVPSYFANQSVSVRHRNAKWQVSIVYCDQTQLALCYFSNIRPSISQGYLLCRIFTVDFLPIILKFHRLSATLTFSHMMAAGMKCDNVSTRCTISCNTKLNLH